MWSRLSLPIGVIILLLVGGLAPAQDTAPPPMEDPPDAGDAPEAQPTTMDGVNEGDAIEGEIETAPPYEDEYKEDLRERYFRITEDWIKPQMLGLGNVGRVPAWPRGVIRAGPFRFTPYLSPAIGWESNPELREEDDENQGDVEDSWFWEIRTGFLGDAKFMADKLTIRTVLDFLYREYTREGIDGDWEGLVGVSGRYDFPAGWWLEAGIQYKHLFDVIDEEDVPGRLERDDIDIFLDAGLDQLFQRLVGQRFKLEVGFDFRTRDFDDHEFRLGNREEAEGHIRLSYNAIRELWAYVEYTHGERWVDSKRLNDGSYDDLSLGVDGEYPITKSGRLLGTVFIGIKNDRFDDEDTFAVGSDRLHTDSNDDDVNISGGAQLRYLMGTRTTITLLYVRDTVFSLEDNYQETDRVDLHATHMILNHFVGRVGGYWEYDNPTRADPAYRYGAGAGVRYVINDFMDADLSYDAMWRNDVDVNGTDYDNHRVMLGLTFYLR